MNTPPDRPAFSDLPEHASQVKTCATGASGVEAIAADVLRRIRPVLHDMPPDELEGLAHSIARRRQRWIAEEIEALRQIERQADLRRPRPAG